MSRPSLSSYLVVGLLVVLAACGAKKPPAAGTSPSGSQPQAQFPGAVTAPTRPAQPPPPEPAPVLVPDPAVVSSDPLAGLDADAINAKGILAPVFFRYDSDAIDDEGQKVLMANAEVLKKYPTWAVTIEGHSDERGTAEYNLALGERRALAAKTYLVSLGIPADRLRTVSYGKEFPFDPGHDEAAFAKNRRGHFVVTAK
jgi:peptidoglycan-associated lipoprotein